MLFKQRPEKWAKSVEISPNRAETLAGTIQRPLGGSMWGTVKKKKNDFGARTGRDPGPFCFVGGDN